MSATRDPGLNVRAVTDSTVHHNRDQRVAEFDQTFFPHVPPEELLAMRLDRVAEEGTELLAALASGVRADIAHELADLEYCVLGVRRLVHELSRLHRIDLDAAFDAVHAANMAKLDKNGEPILRSDGKVMKPPGWRAPDMARAVGTSHYWKVGDRIEWDVFDWVYTGRITSICLDAAVAAVTSLDASSWVVDLTEARRPA